MLYIVLKPEQGCLVYNEIEIGGAKEQCVAHGYDFRNYLSRAIPNKKTGD